MWPFNALSSPLAEYQKTLNQSMQNQLANHAINQQQCHAHVVTDPGYSHPIGAPAVSQRGWSFQIVPVENGFLVHMYTANGSRRYIAENINDATDAIRAAIVIDKLEG
jgi:hypothetical protein